MDRSSKGLLFLGASYILAGVLLIIANGLSYAQDAGLRIAYSIIFIIADSLLFFGISIASRRQEPEKSYTQNNKNDIATLTLASIASLVFVAGSICLLVGATLACWILWTTAAGIFFVALISRLAFELRILTNALRNDEEYIEFRKQMAKYDIATQRQRYYSLIYCISGTLLYLFGLSLILVGSAVIILDTSTPFRIGNILWIVGSAAVIAGSVFKIKQATIQSPRKSKQDIVAQGN